MEPWKATMVKLLNLPETIIKKIIQSMAESWKGKDEYSEFLLIAGKTLNYSCGVPILSNALENAKPHRKGPTILQFAPAFHFQIFPFSYIINMCGPKNYRRNWR
jgi:hypothetical protein